MAISLTTPWYPKVHFKVSPLCYVCKSYPQYQAAVKLLGSFRLTAGNRHLHRYCIFTEQIPETVLQSLYHSCTSELHYSLLNKFNANPLFIKEWTISSSKGSPFGCLRVVSTASSKNWGSLGIAIFNFLNLGFTDTANVSKSITRLRGKFRYLPDKEFRFSFLFHEGPYLHLASLEIFNFTIFNFQLKQDARRVVSEGSYKLQWGGKHLFAFGKRVG